VPKSAKELKLEYSFPSEEQQKNDILIESGRGICLDPKDNVYVSDSKARKILKFDFQGNFLKSFGRKGQGPGEYTSPGSLICDPERNLLVDGLNRQMLTFDPNGEFVKSFRIEKSYSGYAIDGEGRIYANYRSREYEKEDLIEVLDRGGATIRAFGKRILFKNITPSHNEVRIDISRDQRLFMVWEEFNVFRIYSLEGKVLAEGKFSYKSLDEISDVNLESKMVNGSITFRNLFGGMCEDNGKLYLLRNYPRMEIFEGNDKGEIENIYWFKTGYDYIGRDLFIVHRNGRRYFVTLQVFPEVRVEVFSIADDTST
jgi:hypothetical protein